MKRIEGHAKSIRDVLSNKRYVLDYYQREYRWTRKQVSELVEDLTEQFFTNYDESHERQAVAEYGHYFLGSIILSQRGADVFIIDGQQRLTTLSLLLMILHRGQSHTNRGVRLDDLVFSTKFGERKFNISVPERAVAMDALFNGRPIDLVDASESVQNIASRFEDLEELVEESELDSKSLPYFCDWLIDNVNVVEITAATDEDVYTIFETMNDRGLSLTPLDMLKGYLLAKIKQPEKRNLAATVVRDRIDALRKFGKDEDSDAIKAWLRGRHAQSVRERQRGAENQDFERIGTEFHRWVDSHDEILGLSDSDGVFQFAHDELPFYLRQYERLRRAALYPTDGLEPVYYVACYNFALQYPMLLAVLDRADPPAVIDRKIRLVATFLDILLARRAVNYLSLTYSALNYTLFALVKEMRGKELSALANLLVAWLNDQGTDFDGTKDGLRKGFSRFALNVWSKRYIKVLLARMTVWVEREAGIQSSVATYLAEGKSRFEVEHIWADKYQRHTDEFGSEAEFSEFRNRVGGLLLLPKSFNASYGDLTYKRKLPHYNSQNLLARSLNPQCYDRNPGFREFIDRSELLFHPHEEFQKADLEERVQLYRSIAERVWDTDRLNECLR